MRIAALILLMAMASCTGIKKLKQTRVATTDSTHQVQTDSSSRSSTDSGRITRTDSTATKEIKSTSETRVTITIDTACYPEPVEGHHPYHSDYPPKASDYEDKPPENRISVTVSGDGAVDVNLGRLKPLKVQVDHTGRLQTKDSTRLFKTDSAYHKTTDTTATHKAETTTVKKKEAETSKSKQSTRWPLLIQVAAGVFLLVMLFFIARHVKQRFYG